MNRWACCGRARDGGLSRADLSVPEQIDDMVAETRRRFGQIDIVVNNAVTRTYANIEDLPVEAWNYALAVNLSAPFHIVRQSCRS